MGWFWFYGVYCHFLNMGWPVDFSILYMSIWVGLWISVLYIMSIWVGLWISVLYICQYGLACGFQYCISVNMGCPSDYQEMFS